MAFTPRTTAPTNFTTWYGSYNSWNRYSSYGNEGNCTWYAYGRTGEIANRNIYNEFYITQSPGNGKDWIYNTWQSYTHTSGVIDIQLGDILVWGGGTYGHVEVVEGISGNNITTSYSISGNTWASSMFFGTRVISKPSWGSYLGTVHYNDGSSSYLTNTFIGYIHNPYVSGGGGGGDTPSVSVSPSSPSGTLYSTDTYIDFQFTITVTGIPENEDASSAISFSSNCYRYAYTTGWIYNNYTSGGVTYRKAQRSLIVRYDRLHSYAYTDNAYMYYIKTFSNGSVNSSTRMRITIQAQDDDMEYLYPFLIKNRNKRKHVRIKLKQRP